MKRKPGVQKAEDFILNGIDSGKFCAGTFLPSIKELAAKAEVSFVTMWKTIDKLREMGVLETNNGGKRVIVSAKGARPPSASKSDQLALHPERSNTGLLWQTVKERIKRDVLVGRYPAGEPLPPHKELQSFYDISFPTLKKSLEALVGEEIISVYHKGYKVPSLTGSDSHARIVALGCGWEDGRIWTDYLDKNYFRLLETECIHAKINLDIVVYFNQGDDIQFIHSATRMPYNIEKEDILGIVYIVANLEIPPELVLKKISLLKKPISVLDVVGGWKFPEYVMKGHNFQFFTVTTSSRPATQMAQYLLSLGHSQIAYFSPFHNAFWSQVRLEGLKEIYTTAGFPRAVSAFVLPQYRYQWDYLQDRKEPEDTNMLIEEFNKWKKYANNELFRRFGSISYSISKYLTEWNCASGEIYYQMLPFFRKALLNKEITGWVMSNDFTATLAIDFLKQENVRIPKDISVVAFDNTLDAMENRLTSYNFDNIGIIKWMLRFVVRPSSFVKNLRKKVFEPEGSIIERQSSGKAPK